jgi:hypothetical protein
MKNARSYLYITHLPMNLTAQVVRAFKLSLMAWLALGLAAAEAGTIPPEPKYEVLPLPLSYDGAVSREGAADFWWLASRPLSESGSKKDCWHWGLVERHWNPATGTTSQTPLALEGSTNLVTTAERNVWFTSSTSCKAGSPWRVGLRTPRGLMTIEMPEDALKHVERLVPLSDEVVYALSRNPTSQFPTGFVFHRQGLRLVAQAVPELPMAYRRDYAVVALDDHRVMLVGGSHDEYRGCTDCRSGTEILDTRTMHWSPGPAMLEARSEAGAARLPDGSVLVAGGWTKEAFWGPGPSNTAELWDPRSNAFHALPPMPVANAQMRPRWAPGHEGKILLMAEGVSAGIAAFDVEKHTWYLAATLLMGSEEGGCVSFSFSNAGKRWIWQSYKAEGTYSSRSCLDGPFLLGQLVEPRVPGGTAASNLDNQLSIGGTSAGFLPSDGTQAAMIVGGVMGAGMNGYPDSGAVTGVSPQGEAFALPSLNHQRRAPQVVRLGPGLLVLGGHNDNAYRREFPPLPAEWLASTEEGLALHWHDISDTGLTQGATIAPALDGGLLELGADGALFRLHQKQAASENTLRFERIVWAHLQRLRRGTEASPIQLHELPDGRVVVTGGEVQAERMALWSPKADQAGTPDVYVGVGDWSAVRGYETVQADGRGSNMGQPAPHAGGVAVSLNDGRVANGYGGSADTLPAFEIYDPASRAWLDLPAEPAGMHPGSPWRLFGSGHDLVLAGSIDTQGPGRRLRAIWRYDVASNAWQDLWQEPSKNTSPIVGAFDRAGAFVLVTLPDGRRDVIPLDGL